jgi:hypothetical protein
MKERVVSDDENMTVAQRAIGDFAPKLVELTDDVLFGDVWEREELSKRDAAWPPWRRLWPAATPSSCATNCSGRKRTG